MKKVMVIGCPGAGKSTFARKLQELTGLPLYYLDMIWHKPDRTNISREEFDRRIREIVSQDAWIIDGNYNRTLELRMRECDTVFFLDYPLEVCLEKEEEFDEEFRQWILDFPKDQLPEIYALLEKYRGSRDIYTFRSRDEAEQYLERERKRKMG